jgi:hypothetical protein
MDAAEVEYGFIVFKPPVPILGEIVDGPRLRHFGDEQVMITCGEPLSNFAQCKGASVDKNWNTIDKDVGYSMSLQFVLSSARRLERFRQLQNLTPRTLRFEVDPID